MRSDIYRGYNGYLVEVGRHRVVFGGDTAYTDSFRQVRSAQPVHLAIMPIGAYDPVDTCSLQSGASLGDG